MSVVMIKGVSISRGMSTSNVVLNFADNKIEYEVVDVPICCYDQHSRARIGVSFLDYRVSAEPRYVFYTSLFDMIDSNSNWSKVVDTLLKLETVRTKSNNPQQFNLMSRSCSYRVIQTIESLQGQMSRRLKFCEEEFIVGVHWKLRFKLINQAGYSEGMFAPHCDRIRKCDYSSADYLSNMFGCLFASCGRWPAETNYATFNKSCTDKAELSRQLGIEIPDAIR